MIATIAEAVAALRQCWPHIVEDCRAVLGSELHYQAMSYHCLRLSGVPRDQLGMNVKQWIVEPVTPLFQKLDLRKHQDFHGGFEPIPDVVIFHPDIAGDWRRRNNLETMSKMLLAVEIKASERAKGRLGAAEIVRDILKLAAHRAEVRARAGDMHPVMMVIDTAPLIKERMTAWSISIARETAAENDISFLYVSPDDEHAVWALA